MIGDEAPALSEEATARCPFGYGAQSEGEEEMALASNAKIAGKIYREVKGPVPRPLLGWRGNALSYFRKPVPYLEDLRKRFGNVAALAQGGNDTIIYRPIPGHVKQTVFGFGPEVNREVLTQPDVFGGGDFRAPEDAPWINANMISVNGERRLQHKAILSPAFTRDHLKNYFFEMSEEIDRMLEGWQGRQRIDLDAEAYVLAARIASRCFYGQEPDVIENNLAVTIRNFANALLHPMSALRLKLPGTPYWQLSRLAPRIRQLLDEELKRKEKLGYAGNDALSMMMRAQSDTRVLLSEDQVLGCAVGLFLAGHDVPANGLIYLVALLASHPEASRRLMAEIDRELGDRQISYEQIFRLPELDHVFQESLRILSPAFLIFRQARVDTSLGDCEIPRGTEVLLSPFMTNTDPATFENPRHYLPERWSKVKPSPFEFMPFGFGTRRCLGASFAEIQLKLAITKIFQRFRLEPSKDARIDFKYTISLQPQGRLHFDVHRQDRSFGKESGKIAGDFSKFVESA